MTTTTRCLLGLLVITIVAVPGAAQQVGNPSGGVLELKVNCDDGDDLQAALNRAAKAGFARIRVSGICNGSFSVHSNNAIELFSEDPIHGAMLRPGAGAALSAFGPGYLQVSDVIMTGGKGLHASGERRVVILRGSEIDADTFGARVDPGAGVLIEDSYVRGVLGAIRTTGANVVVLGSRLYSDGQVVRASGGQVHLEETEIATGDGGVLAHDRSNVSVVGGELSENGFAHFGAFEDSRLILYNVQVGSEDDSTVLALAANSGAAVEIYNDAPLAEIWGSVNVHGEAYVTFEGATLNGSINLREFSRLHLDGTVLGNVGCGSAADAFCGPNAHTRTVNCASAEPICRPLSKAGDGERDGDKPLPSIPEWPRIAPEPMKRRGVSPQPR